MTAPDSSTTGTPPETYLERITFKTDTQNTWEAAGLALASIGGFWLWLALPESETRHFGFFGKLAIGLILAGVVLVCFGVLVGNLVIPLLRRRAAKRAERDQLQPAAAPTELDEEAQTSIDEEETKRIPYATPIRPATRDEEWFEK